MQKHPLEHHAHHCSFSPDRQDPYLRLDTVSVFVRDLEQSLRFYIDQLGFRPAHDFLLPSGDRWVSVAPPDGTGTISLVSPEAGTRDHACIGRRTHAAFFTGDIESVFQQWQDRGVRFQASPAGAEGGPISATFQDPDGNSFDLVAFDKWGEELEHQRRSHFEQRELQHRMAFELDMARQTQAKLLPECPPTLKNLDCCAACFQAREVGGDYYDFLALGRERTGLIVGDVAGKGTAAALLMANLQATMRNLCTSYWSRPYVPIALDQPGRLLQTANRLLYENTAAHAYVTLFFAEFDDTTRCLRYANCGHPSALLLRSNDSLDRLSSTAPVLGLSESWTCDIGECELSPGDTVAVYTDGVTEAFNEDGEEFGEERLADTLARYRHLSARELSAAIRDEIHRFNPTQQSDDITLMIAKCR